MKDKTHDMNRGYSAEEAEDGFAKLPDSEMASQRDRKLRQQKWAGLDENDALKEYEDVDEDLRDYEFGGFLARNSYQGRY